MTNNVNVFTIYKSLIQNVIKILLIIFQNMTKALGKSSKSQYLKLPEPLLSASSEK